MVEGEVKICDVHDLVSRMRQTAFKTIAPEQMVLRIPQYVPPVVIAADAERWMAFAGELIRSWAAANAEILATAHYEDRLDPGDCSIVLSIHARRTGTKETIDVDCEWLDKIGILADELLARSVALTFHGSGDTLAFDFRLPVQRYGAKSLVHRDIILLVEDDRYVLQAEKEVLELSGYRVIAEPSAEDALRACEEHGHSICLVISDVTLPKQDGKRLAQAVRASMPEVPVLLISGYSEKECEDPKRRIYFLAKPFNSAALLGAARRCLSEKEPNPVAVPAGSPGQGPTTAWC